MSAFRILATNTPIVSRIDAEREARGAAMVWAIIAIELALAAAGTLDLSESPSARLTCLLLCVAALGMAGLSERRKSVAWAGAAMAAAVVMSGHAVLRVLDGDGALIMIPVFLLPFAVQGLRGARALGQA